MPLPPTTPPRTKRSVRELRLAVYGALRELHTMRVVVLRECAEDLESAAVLHRGFKRHGASRTLHAVVTILRAIADLAELGPAAAGVPPDAH